MGQITVPLQPMEAFPNDIRKALAASLPGMPAHDVLMPFKRPTPEQAIATGKNPRISAVLLPLFRREGRWHTLLTRRQEYPGAHSGQISLPGGKQEKSDTSLVHTALRESEEEVGLAQDSVDVLGALTPLYIPPSNFVVHPYVGWLNEPAPFTADPGEVAELLPAPLDAFVPENMRIVREINSGKSVRFEAGGYDVSGHFVWGATAMILAEFAEVVRPLLADR